MLGHKEAYQIGMFWAWVKATINIGPDRGRYLTVSKNCPDTKQVTAQTDWFFRNFESWSRAVGRLCAFSQRLQSEVWRDSHFQGYKLVFTILEQPGPGRTWDLTSYHYKVPLMQGS